MSDNEEFIRQVVSEWRQALDACRRAGATSINVPVTTMAIILNTVEDASMSNRISSEWTKPTLTPPRKREGDQE